MRCAIVGSGLAALAAHATLRSRGVAAEEIAVFGTHADPTVAWRDRAESIRQRQMRSESDGHLAPASFPGLALYRPTIRSLVDTALSRYHPTVTEFLSHAESVRAKSGWERSFVPRRVERIRAVDAGFSIDGDEFEHVLVATGHPGLARIPGAVHAYEPHSYAAKVAIVGAGMAAATEWRNALAEGSEVVSVRRREPVFRPLNVPRELFSKRGLDRYRRTDRARVLRGLSQPTYPAELHVDVPVADTPPAGFQVIAATGFLRGFRQDPLLADLVEAHGLATRDRWIVLDDDSTVPGLTDDRRTLSLAGVAGQWAFPAADTIAGAKYAARAFARRVCRTR
jgi:cation diffusion facilitator CzcD-associated flavoprotein CzcO